MKVTRVETRCVNVKLEKPIGSALGHSIKTTSRIWSERKGVECCK